MNICIGLNTNKLITSEYVSFETFQLLFKIFFNIIKNKKDTIDNKIKYISLYLSLIYLFLIYILLFLNIILSNNCIYILKKFKKI